MVDGGGMDNALDECFAETVMNCQSTVEVPEDTGTNNNAPTANSQSVSVESKSIVITLTGIDPDGDALTFSIVGGPANGVLSAITQIGTTSAKVTYTPNPNFNGVDSFTFKVNDGTLDSNIATVEITVNAVVTTPDVSNAHLSRIWLKFGLLTCSVPLSRMGLSPASGWMLSLTSCSGPQVAQSGARESLRRRPHAPRCRSSGSSWPAACPRFAH